MAKGIRIILGVVKNVIFTQHYDKYEEILRAGHKENFTFRTRDGKRAYFFRGIFDGNPGVVYEE